MDYDEGWLVTMVPEEPPYWISHFWFGLTSFVFISTGLLDTKNMGVAAGISFLSSLEAVI